jgi:nitrite reductase (NADH) small subunit
METWIPICREQELPLQGALPLTVARKNNQLEPVQVAVFRTAQGVFAVHDRCPHRGGPLSQGEVDGQFVYCPMHGWKIDLVTGQAKQPGRGCAKRIAVQLQRGEVLLNLDSLETI